MDKVFLRENGASVSKRFKHVLQDLQDDGFLDFGVWEGQSPAAQQEWYNRCSQEDLGGAYSWILFSDLDEYPVHINGYACMLSMRPVYRSSTKYCTTCTGVLGQEVVIVGDLRV